MYHKERLVEQLNESFLLFGRVPTRRHKVSNYLPYRDQGTTQSTRWTQKLSGDQPAHRLWADAKNTGCFFNRVRQAGRKHDRFAIQALIWCDLPLFPWLCQWLRFQSGHDVLRAWITKRIHTTSFRVTTMDEILGPLCPKLAYLVIAGFTFFSSPR
jgi:hypothetical protein